MTQLDQFHWHEVLDRANTMSEVFTSLIMEHLVIKNTPELQSIANKISEDLSSLYQMIGDADPYWKERGAQLSIVGNHDH